MGTKRYIEQASSHILHMIRKDLGKQLYTRYIKCSNSNELASYLG